MNTIIGVLLGFLLFKLGELIFVKIYKGKFIEVKFDKALLNKKNKAKESRAFNVKKKLIL